MSLILEALRRSEAARRRGELPRLLDGPMPAARRPASWPWLIVALLLGLLLAVLATAWWGGRSDVAGLSANAPMPATAWPATGDARAADPTWTPAPRQPPAPATPAHPAPLGEVRRPEEASGSTTGALDLIRLGAAERAALPPLRISMHVYADDPAQRLVIVDGQRLREGDAPAPGLILREIRRDGLLLDWQGRALWVAR
ncbi:MAG TPA: hypothetical protein DCM32_01335 [Xanthomonadaceae bacterium]|jgi:general secretion pathway protein B|nr:hypothetical protein [Xanthomonadaceae bacterium]